MVARVASRDAHIIAMIMHDLVIRRGVLKMITHL
jgi:hypothetical protein